MGAAPKGSNVFSMSCIKLNSARFTVRQLVLVLPYICLQNYESTSNKFLANI